MVVGTVHCARSLGLIGTNPTVCGYLPVMYMRHATAVDTSALNHTNNIQGDCFYLEYRHIRMFKGFFTDNDGNKQQFNQSLKLRNVVLCKCNIQVFKTRYSLVADHLFLWG